MSLLPKEHGAYGQMAFPLVTSFAVAGVTMPALLLALGVIAGFLAHEPLLVLIGKRGARARRDQRRRAVGWLTVASATGVASGLLALASMPAAIRWSFALPLIPAVFLAATIPLNREKSGPAEVAVALGFAFVAVPAIIAANAPVETAFAVAIAFALTFISGTLAVRGIILDVRGGGQPRAASATRHSVMALAILAVAALWVAAIQEVLPWTTLVAAAPGLLMATWLSLFPLPAARLRTVGWTLIAASTTAAMILAAGLRVG